MQYRFFALIVLGACCFELARCEGGNDTNHVVPGEEEDSGNIIFVTDVESRENEESVEEKEEEAKVELNETGKAEKTAETQGRDLKDANTPKESLNNFAPVSENKEFQKKINDYNKLAIELAKVNEQKIKEIDDKFKSQLKNLDTAQSLEVATIKDQDKLKAKIEDFEKQRTEISKNYNDTRTATMLEYETRYKEIFENYTKDLLNSRK